MNVTPITARNPMERTTGSASGTRQYMSLKNTVPLFIISRHASFTPACTMLPVKVASTGQMYRSSHSLRGLSSA